MLKALTRSSHLARLAIAALALSASSVMAAPGANSVEGAPLRGVQASDLKKWESVAMDHFLGLMWRMNTQKDWRMGRKTGVQSQFSDVFFDMVMQKLAQNVRIVGDGTPMGPYPREISVNFEHVRAMNAMRITTVAYGDNRIIASYSSIHDVVEDPNGVIIPLLPAK